MTLIHGSGTPPQGRLEEGTALQKRLLQDLERQWLDIWGQADLAQAQAAAAADKPAFQDDAAASGDDPAIAEGQQAVSPGGGPGTAVASRATPQAGATSQAPRSSGMGGSSRDVAAHRDLDDSRGARPQPTAAAELSPQAASADDRSCPTRTQAEGDDIRLASPAAVAGPEIAGQHPLAGQNEVVPAGDGQAPAGRWGVPMRGAVETEAVVADSSGPVLTEVKPAATAAPSSRQPPPSAQAREGSKGAPRAAASRPPPTSSESKPPPRHLMLREVGEREVLASMRDAMLDAHESKWAAQGLARALMQAGYARVQVVVNGQQQSQRESTVTDAVLRPAALRPASTPSESTNTPSIGHGHQR